MPDLVRWVSSLSDSDNNDLDEDQDNFLESSQFEDEIEEEQSVLTQTASQLSNNPKVVRVMRQLESSYNPNSQKTLDAQQDIKEGSEDTSEETAQMSDIGQESEIGRNKLEVGQNNEPPNLITDVANIATTNSQIVPKYEEPKHYN